MADSSISFIVPIYNVEAYVTACVESIMRFQDANAQIILVDDGSPDGSGALCDALAKRDSRIEVVHKANAGVSAARNTGLERAKNKWICFVDGDDVIFPEALTKARELLERDLDVLFFSWMNFSRDSDLADQQARCTGEVIEYTPQDIACVRLNTLYRTDLEDMARLGFRYTYSRSIWQALWNARIIREHNVRFVPNMRMAQDVLFRMTCLSYCKTGAYIDLNLYGYRAVTASVTHKMNARIQDILDMYMNEIRGIVREVYRDDARMLSRMYAAMIMESRRLIDLYLNHPDCPLEKDERVRLLDQFRKRPLMAESITKCDGARLVDPIDKLYDAYKITDANAMYDAAVRAVDTGRSHALVKRALEALGLKEWAKYTYRKIKAKLRGRKERT